MFRTLQYIRTETYTASYLSKHYCPLVCLFGKEINRISNEKLVFLVAVSHTNSCCTLGDYTFLQLRQLPAYDSVVCCVGFMFLLKILLEKKNYSLDFKIIKLLLWGSHNHLFKPLKFKDHLI